MSAITKLFIVLLVVCSLLLVAAQVVFVNRTEDYKKRWVDEQTQRKLVEQAREAAFASEQAARTQIQALNAYWQAKVGELSNNIADAQKAKDQAVSDLATAQKQIQVAQAQNSVQAETIQNAQKTQDAIQKTLDEVRVERDKYQLRTGELDGTVVDLNKQLMILNSKLRVAMEDTVNLKNEVAKLSAVARAAGINVGNAPKITTPPPITGAIRNVRELNGNLYATVNVGTADSVEKGMQFKVISQNGQFMGLFTVDTVDKDESFGRLEGKDPAQIKPEMLVKTQL